TGGETGAVHSQTPARRRGMEYLRERPVGTERHGESVSGVKTGGGCAGVPAHGPRAEARARTGRIGKHQFVRAVLPGAGRCGGLGHGAGDAAGTADPAALVLCKPVRDFVVVAGNPGADGDPVRATAGVEDSGGGTAGRTVPETGTPLPGICVGLEDSDLAELLPAGGSGDEIRGAAALETAAAAGFARGGEVAAGTSGAERGSGRDLPGDDEFDLRADGAGLCAGRSDHLAGDRGTGEIRDRGERHDPAAAVHVAGMGYGDRHGGAGRGWVAAQPPGAGARGVVDAG